jgi:hypothetical protein
VKESKVSSCPLPLCGSVRNVLDENKEMMLKCDHLQPGDMVSIDQYISVSSGRLPHTKGKEPKKEKYCGFS